MSCRTQALWVSSKLLTPRNKGPVTPHWVARGTWVALTSGPHVWSAAWLGSDCLSVPRFPHEEGTRHSMAGVSRQPAEHSAGLGGSHGHRRMALLSVASLCPPHLGYSPLNKGCTEIARCWVPRGKAGRKEGRWLAEDVPTSAMSCGGLAVRHCRDCRVCVCVYVPLSVFWLNPSF